MGWSPAQAWTAPGVLAEVMLGAETLGVLFYITNCPLGSREESGSREDIAGGRAAARTWSLGLRCRGWNLFLGHAAGSAL